MLIVLVGAALPSVVKVITAHWPGGPAVSASVRVAPVAARRTGGVAVCSMLFWAALLLASGLTLVIAGRRRHRPHHN